MRAAHGNQPVRLPRDRSAAGVPGGPAATTVAKLPHMLAITEKMLRCSKTACMLHPRRALSVSAAASRRTAFLGRFLPKLGGASCAATFFGCNPRFSVEPRLMSENQLAETEPPRYMRASAGV